MTALAGMSFAALLLLAATDAPSSDTPAETRSASAEVASVAKVYSPRLVLGAAAAVAPTEAAEALESYDCEAVRVSLDGRTPQRAVAGT